MTQGTERRFTPDLISELFRNALDPGYADAAARRARRGPDSPRQVLVGRVARALVLVAAGLLLFVAYQQTVAAHPGSSRAQATLVDDVRARQAETDAMQQQADQLRDRVSRLRDAALAGSADAAMLKELESITGVTKVSGGGAVVKLTDAPPPVDPITGQSTGTNLGKVQDRDLQAVVNELWYDGAEAISINGERLTALSTIRTAGQTILVDFRPVTSPYEVSAIGPGDLNKRFAGSGTGALFRQLASAYHMQVSVHHDGSLTLPAAADPQLRYARPLPTPSEPAPGAGSGTPTAGTTKGR